ncbi:DinB family protein [Colwellia echini]|uniref:Damage-inducible protein DinB n=1 Tax=Colwellia echini TaxID=1982103 RepID=A0ABY3MYL8_9GAMM|nr:DinB family protein [Colwellia echini]TYK66321.1 damage-inducible protein DinB [Colwellia echini]
MNLLSHFILMADYNHRMNIQFSNVIDNLSEEITNEDLGAYFISIMGTLNHILVGDIIWLSRFSKHSNNYLALKSILELPKPNGLNDMIFPEFSSFKIAREKVDLSLSNWLKYEVDTIDFTKNLEYSSTKGIISTRNFGELLSHLFNHQTHHRGQLSTLLNQQGLDVGVTDFLVEIPEISTKQENLQII